MKNFLVPPLLFALIACSPDLPRGVTATERPWRSELYGKEWTPPGLDKNFYADKFLQDYSYAGYRLGQEAIPHIEAPLFDVTASPFEADPTGSTDSTEAIQKAIDAAGEAGGGVVLIPEGRYLLSTHSNDGSALRITRPNIVLRGAGPERTFLLNTSYDRPRQRIISVAGSDGDWNQEHSPAVPVSRDLMGPTRVIPVEETGGFSPGDWVVIRTTATKAWADEHREPGWRDHVGGGSLRGLAYYRQILAVEEGQLVVDIPTRYAMKTRDSARVHHAPDQLTEVGIENFSIGNVQHPNYADSDHWTPGSFNNPDHHASEVHHSVAILFARTRDSWIRNVHSFQAPANTSGAHLLSDGVNINSSRSITLENVRMQKPVYGGGGGNGYMFRVGRASDILLKDCLASHSRHGFAISNMTSTGIVIHDSKDRHTDWQAADNRSAGGRNSDHHMFFSHSNLIDHSRVRDSMFEARYRPFTSPPQHNITAAHTTFWNIKGLGSGTHAVHSDQARYGYVIGTQGLDNSSRYRVRLGNGERPQTLPEDHVEGVGEGATLQPPSLYLDQLERRRSSIQIEFTAAKNAVLPDHTTKLAVHSTIGDKLGFDQDDLTYRWTLIDGPGPVEFSAPNNPATRIHMETAGDYQVKISVTADDYQTENNTSVSLSSQ